MPEEKPEVLNVFEKIAQTHIPFDSDKKYDINSSNKVKAILEELKEIKEKHGKQIDYFTDNKLGIIVANSFKEKNIAGLKEKLNNINLVLDSHIDLIKLFNTDENLKLTIKKIKNEVKVERALDNTITNAILLNILKQKDLDDDTLILFSIGEEYYCEEECDINEDEYCGDIDCRGFEENNGAKKLAKIIKQKDLQKKIRVINLDVTENDYHKFDTYLDDQKNNYSVFIEYSKNFKGKKYKNYCKNDDEKIKKKYRTLTKFADYKNKNKEFIIFCNHKKKGTGDNLEKYQKKGIFGITFGLSTFNTIHSLQNYTTQDRINKYNELLKDMIEYIKTVKLD